MIPINYFTRSTKYFATAVVTLSLLGGSLGFVPTVAAASLTVTTSEDELNEDGDCSLREAIVAANTDTAVDACIAGNGADTIELGAGTYELTLEGNNENAAGTGDLDISDDVTIRGQSAEETIIDANSIDRVFDIQVATNVTLSNVTIQNGTANAGAGILNQDGALTLDHVIITSNQALSSGGGVFNVEGSLFMQNTDVVANDGGGDGVGGLVNWGKAIIVHSTFVDNDGFRGGAIENEGVLIVSSTDITNNGSTDFGGIRNHSSGALAVYSSVIDSNGGGRGGGVMNEGKAVISDTIIQNNRARGGISGMRKAIGGGIYNLGTMSVYTSTINGNQVIASDPNAGLMFGGGIANEGDFTLINSTVSGNLTDDQFGESSGFGGGIFNDSQMVINNSTIADNQADDEGGGLNNQGTVNVANSIFAHNQVLRGAGPDCSGTLTSQGHNALENSEGCTLDGDASGDIVDVDTQLGALEDHGGSTPTHALLEGSPAIDAGNPAEPGSDKSACQASDQRGVSRPQGEQCDIGAYELADDS